MSQPTIKSCPHCGKTAQQEGGVRLYRHLNRDGSIDEMVNCTNCGLAGPFKDTRDEAVKHWNWLDMLPTS